MIIYSILDRIFDDFYIDEDDRTTFGELLLADFAVEVPEIRTFPLPDNTDRILLDDIDPLMIQILFVFKGGVFPSYADEPILIGEISKNSLLLEKIERIINTFDELVMPPVVMSDETGEWLVYEEGASGILFTKARELDLFMDIPKYLEGLFDSFCRYKIYDFIAKKRLLDKNKTSIELLVEASMAQKGLVTDLTSGRLRTIGLRGLNLGFDFPDPARAGSLFRDASAPDRLLEDLNKFAKKWRKKFLVRRETFYGPLVPFL